MSEEVSKQAVRKLPQKSLWITFNNVKAKPGMFRVCLEIDGEEMELFHSYPNLDDGVVSESRNLTWLIGVNTASSK